MWADVEQFYVKSGDLANISGLCYTTDCIFPALFLYEAENQSYFLSESLPGLLKQRS